MSNPDDTRQIAPRKPYEKPAIESNQLFETRALACGKCMAGPFPQFECGAFNFSGS